MRVYRAVVYAFALQFEMEHPETTRGMHTKLPELK